MKLFSIVLVVLSLACLTNANTIWQLYVDNRLIGNGLKNAAIIGHLGGLRAVSSGFWVLPSERRAIVNLFKKETDDFATGVIVGSVRYLTYKSDGRSIYGKKQGSGGVILAKTKESILIGIYDGAMETKNAANVVEKLADYLIENGY